MMERIGEMIMIYGHQMQKLAPKRERFHFFVDLCAARLQDTNYLKHVKAVFFSPT
jgi:hypothetical protein